MGPTDTRIRVLIVDDSALIRKLLADLLRTSPEVEVVGSAKDGEEAIAEVLRLRPDVVTELPLVNTFYGTCRANRHKNRCADHPMRCGQLTCPGFASRIRCLQNKIHTL